ncbi:hypothetical protein E2C01_028660 [Portunus trituberculatus]|uniref:Uncharacterized protein n=1 Tax=Portunus trituberculatus TaxID=210409 RepID=A0A5B7EM42_PORTR|nr:hypothetical protein [Portunus trituberculatus]
MSFTTLPLQQHHHPHPRPSTNTTSDSGVTRPLHKQITHDLHVFLTDTGWVLYDPYLPTILTLGSPHGQPGSSRPPRNVYCSVTHCTRLA